MNIVKVLGIKVNIITMKETLEWIENSIREKTPRQIITGNPEMIMAAQKDESFHQIMNQADLVVPDGIGLVIAARRFLNVQVPERVAGFDICTQFFEIAQQRGYSVYLLGGEPGVVDKAANNLKGKYPSLKISGLHHGYLDEKSKSQVVAEIASLKPDLLLVGMGAPGQEIFIAEYKDKYQVPVSIGVGGSIDVWAGKTKRAPMILQKFHLEWFYRLIREPSRFFRMLALPKFIFYAARYKERRIP